MEDDNTEMSEELSEEMQDFLATVTHQRVAKIDSLKQEVVRLRDYAVSRRRESGIERQWQEDEEYYLGIDDANRSSHIFTKAAGVNGGITRDKNTASGRCSAFFNVTGQFTDSAAARMGDILLPANEFNFVIKATPVATSGDEIAAEAQQPAQQIDPMTGQPLPVMPSSQTANPEKVAQEKELNLMAERAEKRIQDWMVEGRYHVEFRKVIEDAARLGTGVLKGPVPEIKRAKKYLKKDGIALFSGC